MKFLSVLFLLFAICSCDMFSKTKNKDTTNNQSKINTELPTQTADSVSLIYSSDGVISLRLKAPKLVPVDTRLEKYNEFPDGVAISFYNKQGEKNADLVADYGIDNARDETRTAKGNVVITTPEGDTYTTDELFMNARKDSIHNYGKYVKITRKDGTLIQGNGFVSDSRMKNIEILEVYNSVLPVNDSNILP